MVLFSDESKNESLELEKNKNFENSLKIEDDELFDEENFEEVLENNHALDQTPVNCESINHSDSFTDKFIKVYLNK